jgi:crotonobetainyl-CoA:carnitine CoA-transferase CaiB-like acyl-CoA transferase
MDGCFAEAPCDMSEDLAPMTVAGALAHLAATGINAVPVQTLRELVDRHRIQPARTVSFEKRERDGWENECFAPSWFAFDGMPGTRPAAPSRIGSDAPTVLAELGYATSEVERLAASGAVGPIEWLRRDGSGRI